MRSQVGKIGTQKVTIDHQPSANLALFVSGEQEARHVW